MTDVSRTEWDLIANVDGTEYRCVSHSATFALNRIPLASIELAVGRDVRTLEQATIHSTARSLGLMVPVTVTLRPKKYWATWQEKPGDHSPSEPGLWTTAGDHVVFRGYLTGVGYHKSRGQLQASMQLIHWLADLAFSSIFSNQSHPTNPSMYTFNATYPASISGGTAGLGHFIGGTRFKDHITQAAIQIDLWRAIANVFCEISQQDLIRLGSPDKCGGVEAPNDQSLAAMRRIEGMHDCDETESKWHVPLRLASTAQAGLVADAIRNHIAQQSTNSWWATTIWDKLMVDFGPNFAFHVVPRVETAVVAPFVPGLRKHWRAQLFPHDITFVQMSSYMRRPLRGVGVYGGRELVQTYSDRKTGELSSQIGIGGCFMPDPEAKGMVMFKRAPAWLINVPALATAPSRTALGRAPGGPRQPTGSATTPATTSMGGGRDGKSAAEAAIDAADLYDRLAHYLYVQEVLRGREGSLTGKLRYDIAPGSTVKFGMTAGIHQDGDQLRGDHYASVMQVSCVIDAEQGKAGTTFALAHIRNADENEDERTSVASHPLYTEGVYKGAPLVDEYLFDEEEDDTSGEPITASQPAIDAALGSIQGLA